MRQRACWKLLFPVLFAAWGSAGAQMPQLAGATMLQCSGLPCVDLVTGSGKRLRMAIDTGDDASIMDISLAKKLGLGVTSPKGADGKPTGEEDFVILRHVKLGKVLLGDLKVSVLPGISARMARDRMPAANGLLAYTAFKDRLVEFDYRNRKLRVSTSALTGPACPHDCWTLSTPRFSRGGPEVLAADGFSIDGHPVVAQFDTLFSGTMLVYAAAVNKLGLEKIAETGQRQFFKYTDGGVDMLKAPGHVLAAGNRVLLKSAPVYFSTPTVHQPDEAFEVCVGQALLKHSILYIDLHSMNIWIA
jgi:hypothetical protein